jgi:hypothetical protein
MAVRMDGRLPWTWRCITGAGTLARLRLYYGVDRPMRP